jgi:hypothetical protein
MIRLGLAWWYVPVIQAVWEDYDLQQTLGKSVRF